MTQQALYRKWRSRSFEEVVGQPQVTQTLENAVDTDRVAHAYLFSGPRGTGKTSTARILAKVVNCTAEAKQRPCNECSMCRAISEGTALDLIEIDAASNTQVDKVRDVIVEKVAFAPGEARKKVYIIDEVHMLSNSAFNALLKTIEEPPPHAMFILATTEIHKIPATILSRCQRLDFRRIGVEQIAEHLGWVLDQEGVTAEPEVLELVARQATGSMRDALSLLDQLLAHGGNHLTLQEARAALGLATAEAVQGLVDSLLAQDVASALLLVNRLLDQGVDPRQFLMDILEQLRALLLTLAGGGSQLLNLPEEALARLREQRRYVDPGSLVEIIRVFNQAGTDLKLGLQPQLPLELAIVESVLALQRRGTAPAPSVEPEIVDAGQRASSPKKAHAPRTDEGGVAREEGTVEARPSVNEVGALYEGDGTGDDGTPVEEFASYPTTVEPTEGEPQQPIGATNGTEANQQELLTDLVEVVDVLGWWREQWESFKSFLATAGPDGERATLRLKWCEPHRADEHQLILGFRYSIHLEKIESARERAAVEQALIAFRGAPVKLECVLVEGAETMQPAKTKYEEAQEDPVVREALRLGGRIVEVFLPEQPN